MKYKYINLLILIVASLLMTGCNKGVDTRFDLWEKEVESQPLEVMSELENIESFSLSKEGMARYAILYTQCQDKTYVECDNDSLISIAVDYYSLSNDAHHKMLAYHYAATVQNNANNLSLALRYALLAYDEASDLKDSLNLSRIESLIGRIYQKADLYDEALKWDKASLVHAKEVSKLDWVINTYTILSQEMLAMMQDSLAIQYADSALALSSQPDIAILEVKYLVYHWADETTKTDSILSIIHELNYDVPKSILSLEEHDAPRSNIETIAYLNDKIKEQNNYILRISSNNLSEVRNMHNQTKILNLASSLRSERKERSILILCGSLSLIVLVLIIILLYTRAKNHRLNNEAMVRTLQVELIQLDDSLRTTTSQLEELTRSNNKLSQEKSEEVYKYLMLKYETSLSIMKQFSWINKIGNIYVDADNSQNKTWDNIFSRIKKELHVSTGHHIKDEILTSIRVQQPELLEEIEALGLISSEKEMLLYFISGISVRVIRELTGKSEASIYSIKNRIKNKLRAVNTTFSLCVLEKL